MVSMRGRLIVAVTAALVAAGLELGAQRGQPTAPSGSPTAPSVSPTEKSALAARFRNFRPVTDAMLEKPDPADWLNWRRPLDAWGYSPLNQINRSNVHQLQLVWAQALGPRATCSQRP